MADKCVGVGMGIFYIGMAFGEDTQKMLDKCIFEMMGFGIYLFNCFLCVIKYVCELSKMEILL